jgi:hypothetical protein
MLELSSAWHCALRANVLTADAKNDSLPEAIDALGHLILRGVE